MLFSIQRAVLFVNTVLHSSNHSSLLLDSLNTRQIITSNEPQVWKVISDTSQRDEGTIVKLGRSSVCLAKDIDGILPVRVVTQFQPVKAKVKHNGTIRTQLFHRSRHVETDFPGVSVRMNIPPIEKGVMVTVEAKQSDCIQVSVDETGTVPARKLVLIRDDDESTKFSFPSSLNTDPKTDSSIISSSNNSNNNITASQFVLSVLAIHIVDRMTDTMLSVLQVLVEWFGKYLVNIGS